MQANRYWMWYRNGHLGTTPPEDYVMKNGDLITFVYETIPTGHPLVR